MAGTVKDVMTANPLTVGVDTSIAEAARTMRDNGIGALVVEEEGQVHGIVTDRDITIRAVADGYDPQSTPVGAVASTDLALLSPDDDVRNAARLMQQFAVRRLPVVDGSKAVGIVSIGDLAIDRDPDSALAQVSAAPADA